MLWQWIWKQIQWLSRLTINGLLTVAKPTVKQLLIFPKVTPGLSLYPIMARRPTDSPFPAIPQERHITCPARYPDRQTERQRIHRTQDIGTVGTEQQTRTYTAYSFPVQLPQNLFILTGFDFYYEKESNEDARMSIKGYLFKSRTIKLTELLYE